MKFLLSILLILCWCVSVGFAQTNKMIHEFPTRTTVLNSDFFLLDTLTNYNKLAYQYLSLTLKTNAALRGTTTAEEVVNSGIYYGDGSGLTNVNSVGASALATNVVSGISITNATLVGTQARTHSYLYSTGTGGTNFIVDFAQGTTFTVVATNDVNFLHCTNFTATSAEVAVYIYAGDAQRNLTYNGSWQLVQTNAPAFVATNKCAVLALGVKLPGGNNSQTNIIAACAASQ